MNKRTISSLILGATITLAASSATAAPSIVTHIDISHTPEINLVNALVGGNSAIKEITYASFTSALPYHTAGITPDGYVTMSTGAAIAHATSNPYTQNFPEQGQNSYVQYHNQAGGSYAPLAALLTLPNGSPLPVDNTRDANVLTFSFTLNDPTIDTITTSFFFATDETYKQSTWGDPWQRINQDVFAFWVDGVNYALLPNGSIVTAKTALDYYIDGSDYCYNSRTEEITITALLDPSRDVHTITIAIADALTYIPEDANKALYDSAIFFGKGGMTFTASAVPEPETYAMMLAGLAMVGAVARRRRKNA